MSTISIKRSVAKNAGQFHSADEEEARAPEAVNPQWTKILHRISRQLSRSQRYISAKGIFLSLRFANGQMDGAGERQNSKEISCQRKSADTEAR